MGNCPIHDHDDPQPECEACPEMVCRDCRGTEVLVGGAGPYERHYDCRCDSGFVVVEVAA